MDDEINALIKADCGLGCEIHISKEKMGKNNFLKIQARKT
jgi:hypothetical protein